MPWRARLRTGALEVHERRARTPRDRAASGSSSESRPGPSPGGKRTAVSVPKRFCHSLCPALEARRTPWACRGTRPSTPRPCRGCGSRSRAKPGSQSRQLSGIAQPGKRRHELGVGRLALDGHDARGCETSRRPLLEASPVAQHVVREGGRVALADARGPPRARCSRRSRRRAGRRGGARARAAAPPPASTACGDRRTATSLTSQVRTPHAPSTAERRVRDDAWSTNTRRDVSSQPRSPSRRRSERPASSSCQAARHGRGDPLVRRPRPPRSGACWPGPARRPRPGGRAGAGTRWPGAAGRSPVRRRRTPARRARPPPRRRPAPWRPRPTTSARRAERARVSPPGRSPRRRRSRPGARPPARSSATPFSGHEARGARPPGESDQNASSTPSTRARATRAEPSGRAIEPLSRSAAETSASSSSASRAARSCRHMRSRAWAAKATRPVRASATSARLARTESPTPRAATITAVTTAAVARAPRWVRQ